MAGQTTVYVNGLYEVTPQGVTKYYYLGSQRVAMRQSGVLTYLHGDALGSASLATSVTGTVVSSVRYYPYGGTRSGSMATDRRYTGQRWEASVGFYDYGARNYDPALGRFLQADSIVPNPANPQSLNRYSYVLNNPLKYTDPTGHAECFDGACNLLLHPVSGNVMVR
ncbi:MAG: RHS repeat-associated core domain-containing protein, partial [Anaerolineae bacterium]|nr:RHS repeat-associated core domain-containing protein [Anaerolineae bacterium]